MTNERVTEIACVPRIYSNIIILFLLEKSKPRFAGGSGRVWPVRERYFPDGCACDDEDDDDDRRQTFIIIFYIIQFFNLPFNVSIFRLPIF